MIENLVRQEIKKFIPYNANQMPYKVKLDANESPFDISESVRRRLADFFLNTPGLNLYPDTDSNELRNSLAVFWGVSPEQIVVGTGSDQLIQNIISVFVDKGDKVLCPSPSFGMYKLSTTIAGGIPVEFILDNNKDYKYEADDIIKLANKEKAKLIFLCTPNNPTGDVIPEKDIIGVLEGCKNSVVVVDEAYGEFSGETASGLINKYDNLIILRTFSKAYGLAGIRCGYSISGKQMALEINKVRPPYNISSLSQMIARLVLEEKEYIIQQIEYIVNQRKYLTAQLEVFEGVKVYPSKANFLLVKLANSSDVNNELVKRGILVRSFGNSPMLEDCLRISVGNKEQNDILLCGLRDALTANG